MEHLLKIVCDIPVKKTLEQSVLESNLGKISILLTKNDTLYAEYKKICNKYDNIYVRYAHTIIILLKHLSLEEYYVSNFNLEYLFTKTFNLLQTIPFSYIAADKKISKQYLTCDITCNYICSTENLSHILEEFLTLNNVYYSKFFYLPVCLTLVNACLYTQNDQIISSLKSFLDSHLFLQSLMIIRKVAVDKKDNKLKTQCSLNISLYLYENDTGLLSLYTLLQANKSVSLSQILDAYSKMVLNPCLIDSPISKDIYILRILLHISKLIKKHEFPDSDTFCILLRLLYDISINTTYKSVFNKWQVSFLENLSSQNVEALNDTIGNNTEMIDTLTPKPYTFKLLRLFESVIEADTPLAKEVLRTVKFDFLSPISFRLLEEYLCTNKSLSGMELTIVKFIVNHCDVDLQTQFKSFYLSLPIGFNMLEGMDEWEFADPPSTSILLLKFDVILKVFFGKNVNSAIPTLFTCISMCLNTDDANATMPHNVPLLITSMQLLQKLLNTEINMRKNMNIQILENISTIFDNYNPNKCKDKESAETKNAYVENINQNVMSTLVQSISVLLSKLDSHESQEWYIKLVHIIESFEKRCNDSATPLLPQLKNHLICLRMQCLSMLHAPSSLKQKNNVDTPSVPDSFHISASDLENQDKKAQTKEKEPALLNNDQEKVNLSDIIDPNQSMLQLKWRGIWAGLASELAPVKGGCIIELTRMLKDPYCLKAFKGCLKCEMDHAILNVLLDSLRHEDSYVYTAAINCTLQFYYAINDESGETNKESTSVTTLTTKESVLKEILKLYVLYSDNYGSEASTSLQKDAPIVIDESQLRSVVNTGEIIVSILRGQILKHLSRKQFVDIYRAIKCLIIDVAGVLTKIDDEHYDMVSHNHLLLIFNSALSNLSEFIYNLPVDSDLWGSSELTIEPVLSTIITQHFECYSKQLQGECDKSACSNGGFNNGKTTKTVTETIRFALHNVLVTLLGNILTKYRLLRQITSTNITSATLFVDIRDDELMKTLHNCLTMAASNIDLNEDIKLHILQILRSIDEP